MSSEMSTPPSPFESPRMKRGLEQAPAGREQVTITCGPSAPGTVLALSPRKDTSSIRRASPASSGGGGTGWPGGKLPRNFTLFGTVTSNAATPSGGGGVAERE